MRQAGDPFPPEAPVHRAPRAEHEDGSPHALKKLQEEGKIRVKGNRIRILKADSLFGPLVR
jgi:hypothetical protein